MTTTIESVKDLSEAVSHIKVAMVSTVDEHGTISSRPVTVQEITPFGEVVFIVDQGADWVPPADGAAINATLIDEGNAWVSFAGTGSLDPDTATAEELMGSLSSLFFGEDSQPAVLRVRTEQIEWWTAASGARQVFELAKAAISGKTPELGSSGTLAPDQVLS